MHRSRRAKIVATVGPVSADPAMLEALFQAGVDTFRMNFSHGTHEDHARVHAAIRALEAKTGRPIGILMDLQGPKIRIGKLTDGRLTLTPGETIRFVLGEARAAKTRSRLPHKEIFSAISPNHDLLDRRRPGAGARRRSTATIMLEARVIVGGVISNRKGVNLPGTQLDMSPLTGEGSRRPPIRAWPGRRLGRALFRAAAGRPDRGAGADRTSAPDCSPRSRSRQPLDPYRGHHPPVGRRDGGARRPRRGNPARGRARPSKGLVRACRHAVKPVIVATQMLEFDDHLADADARRGLRCRHRNLRRRRRGDAIGRNGDRIFPSRGGRDDGSHHPLGPRRHKLSLADRSQRADGGGDAAARGRGGGRRPSLGHRRPQAIVAYTSSGSTAARIARKTSDRRRCWR